MPREFQAQIQSLSLSIALICPRVHSCPIVNLSHQQSLYLAHPSSTGKIHAQSPVGALPDTGQLQLEQHTPVLAPELGPSQDTLASREHVAASGGMSDCHHWGGAPGTVGGGRPRVLLSLPQCTEQPSSNGKGARERLCPRHGPL